MTTPLLWRFVYLTTVKILAQFKETILFIKHISCSLTQVDVYLAQALANNLYLFQVRTAEFFPTLIIILQHAEIKLAALSMLLYFSRFKG